MGIREQGQSRCNLKALAGIKGNNIYYSTLNSRPVAVAGDDQVITVCDDLVLDGSIHSDLIYCA